MTPDMATEVSVRHAPHPFRAERIHSSVPAGASVAEIMKGVGAAAATHAYIDGHFIAEERRAAVKPKAGAVLTLRAVPMGGGGSKNPLRTILSLALMAASPGISAGILGALGSAGTSAIAGRLVTAGVGLLGRLALNALAPPARPRFAAQKESQTLFIQGAQNRAQPFGRIPRVLGKHRFVPPYGAYPYTETVGGEQYLRLLFVWGYGPLHITDLKIGETPLSSFDDVEVETRYGYEDDTPLTLYSNSVIQNDLAVSAKQTDGYITRTTEADADEIGVDITLPRGLVKFGGGGARLTAKVRIEVQYAPAGTGDWSAGLEAYKPFAARNVALGVKPVAYRKANIAYPVVRVDRIALDAASGAITLLRGTQMRIGVDGGEPQPPAVPAGKIPLARVTRRSDESAPDITDERDPTLAGTNFEAAGDFEVTDEGTPNQLQVAAGGLQFPGIEISGKQTAALRETVTFKVDKGQYDVRIRRVTADAGDDNRTFDETVWTALRTIRYAYPVRMSGLALTALRIKATGQLNGVIERFNGVVTSILPDWTGEEWVEQATCNPASLFRHVLQGKPNARPLSDSRLNLAQLQDWHIRCADSSRECNMVADYDISVRELLGIISATGRAAPALLDGKWGVVEDREQSVPVQHFSPRNTFGFQGRKSFEDVPEALRVRFINRDKGWLQDERLVFDDGFSEETAVRYETLELPGVTSPAQAWQDGRYHIATARLRPETYSFNCDIEHIVCTRGDLIRFSHDVPLFGLISARVAGVAIDGGNVTGVTLDDAVTMEGGKSYAVRFRRADGSTLLQGVVTVAGSGKSVAFLTPVASGDAPVTGDLALFGEAGIESVELIVKSIEPRGDLTARLTCVDTAPAVHGAGSGTIPEFSSQSTVPPEMQRPPAPLVAGIQSGGEALIRNTDGSLSTRILLTLQPPAFGGRLDTAVQIRAQDETRFRQAEVTAQGGHRLSIGDVEEGEIYDLQIRYVTPAGLYSPPLLVAAHRVEGTAALPSDVAVFTANVLGDTAHLAWHAVDDLDLDHYALRFSPQQAGVTWSGAVDIIASLPRDATSVAIPAAQGTYLIKAVDVGGRVSLNAASAVVATEAQGQNAVLDMAEHPHFTGTHDNTAVSDGALQLAGVDSIDDWADIDAVENADIGLAGLNSSGSYIFADVADLGAVYTARLTATLDISALGYSPGIDFWADVDAIESFDDGLDPSLFSLRLQLRMTDDDPDVSPDWSDWAAFTVGDYTARAFQFRVLMAAAQDLTPRLSALSVSIDMPDRLASARGITSDIAGSDIAFSPPFMAVPAITVSPRDMAAGDYFAVTLQSPSGFRIRFFNSGGAGIARSFDYLARGYGEQV